MGQTLKDLLNDSFTRYAERTAIRLLQPIGGDKAGKLSYQPLKYQELEAQRNQLAVGLSRLGLHKGQRIGILTDGGVEPLLVFLATDLIGVSAVPLCNKSAAEILSHSINHSRVEAVVVDPKGYEQLEAIHPSLDHPPRLVLTQGREDGAVAWEELLDAPAGVSPPDVEVTPDDESKILYTSGSSGLPKGVVQTHANIVANIEEVWEVLSDLETVAGCLPGARLAGQDGDRISGEMRLKLGPMSPRFAGEGRISRDDGARRARIVGQASDGASASRARARIDYAVVDSGDGGTRVEVEIGYALSGTLAQFSRGAIATDLVRRLTATFATNLEAAIAGDTAEREGQEAQPLDAGGLLGAVVLARIKAWLRTLFGRRG